MFTKAFWLAVLERALKTFAQTVIAAAGITAVDAATLAILHDTWQTDLELGVAAAALSLVTSIASAGVRSNGPSLATETTEASQAAEPSDEGLEYMKPEEPASESADLL